MKALGVAALAACGFVGFAHAADVALPTTKPAAPAPQNCFANFWAYLDSTAADCPLTYAGFTLYATLDAGLMYNTNGAAWNPAFVNGTQGLISKQSYGSKWLWSPNNINQSVIGIKMSRADRLRLVACRHAGSRLRPAFRLPRQFAALASDEQRQGAHPAKRQRRLEPVRPVGQFAVLHRRQQQDLWHADIRPRQLVGSGRPHRLRPARRGLRLLAVRLHRHLCRLQRHPARALEYGVQVSGGVTPISAPRASRRSAATIRGTAPRQCGRASSAATSRTCSAACCRWTPSSATRRTA